MVVEQSTSGKEAMEGQHQVLSVMYAKYTVKDYTVSCSHPLDGSKYQEFREEINVDIGILYRLSGA